MPFSVYTKAEVDQLIADLKASLGGGTTPPPVDPPPVDPPPTNPPPAGSRAIDGGQNYYAAKGFTYAAAAGWDDPAFFPIGLWLAPILDQSYALRWKDLGLNTAFGLTADSPLAVLRANGIWAILQASEVSRFGALGSETVGIGLADEPNTNAEWQAPIKSLPNATTNNRFFWVNFNWDRGGYVGGLDGKTPAQILALTATTPAGGARRIDLCGTDFYWFAAAEAATAGGFSWPSAGAEVYGQSLFTADQMSHGHHYGVTLDRLRAAQGASTAPQVAFIENGGPYNENAKASNYITPPELNAAVWGSIIHGARAIAYFNHTFAGPAQSNDNINSAYYKTVQAGQSVSIYAQMKATNALVKSLAPIINSPFVDGAVTVTPAQGLFAGIDYMVKSSGGKLHVFGLNRSPSATSATFTVAGVTSGTVTVLNENRTLPLANGKFSDTFTDRNTVHVYRIN